MCSPAQQLGTNAMSGLYVFVLRCRSHAAVRPAHGLSCLRGPGTLWYRPLAPALNRPKTILGGTATIDN